MFVFHHINVNIKISNPLESNLYFLFFILFIDTHPHRVNDFSHQETMCYYFFYFYNYKNQVEATCVLIPVTLINKENKQKVQSVKPRNISVNICLLVSGSEENTIKK